MSDGQSESIEAANKPDPAGEYRDPPFRPAYYFEPTPAGPAVGDLGEGPLVGQTSKPEKDRNG